MQLILLVFTQPADLSSNITEMHNNTTVSSVYFSYILGIGTLLHCW